MPSSVLEKEVQPEYFQVAKKRSLYQRAWAAHPVPNGKRMSSVDRGETIESTQDAEDVKDSNEESGSAGDDGEEKQSPVPSAPPAEEIIEESWEFCSSKDLNSLNHCLFYFTFTTYFCPACTCTPVLNLRIKIRYSLPDSYDKVLVHKHFSWTRHGGRGRSVVGSILATTKTDRN